MGRPKLLLPWGKTTVLGALVRQWKKLDAEQVAVVIARDDHGALEELERLKFPRENRITNPQPECGMFSSIQCAARWTGWNHDLSHWVIGLGDQPHLRSSTLQGVLELASEQPGRVCQPTFEGHARHPVLLPKNIFMHLAGSRASTLKEFLSEFPPAVCEVNDPGLGLDIDYPQDYERALGLELSRKERRGEREERRKKKEERRSVP